MTAQSRRSPGVEALLPSTRQARSDRLHRAILLAASVVFGLVACVGGDGSDDAGPDPLDAFPDHTVFTLEDVVGFDAIAKQGPSSAVLKFVITRFLEAGQRARFLDSSHYALHDEWWWFRLLNGAPIEGVDVAPVDVGRRFETIEEIVRWARALLPAPLPLDLRFLPDGRLYSPEFYQRAVFNLDKDLAIGSLVRFPARPDAPVPGGLPERWALELEYQHQVDEMEVQAIFAALEAALPADLGPAVKLLLRSPQQEEFARGLEEAGSPLAERMLRYSEVTIPGDTEVYAEGLAAGRLRFVRRGESFTDARSTDILVTEDIPDFLPQCAGLITAVPQTALAHVNILAKNRGIPNAYRAGIIEDPNLDQLARVNAPVIVKASAADGLEVVPMTAEQYATFRALGAVPASAVPPVDLTGVALAYDLEALEFADASSWRPVLGGKAAGFLALLDARDVTHPPRPLAISIKPWVEHLDVTTALRPLIASALADRTFQGSADVRFLVLEGEDAWRARHPGRPEFPGQFLSSRAAGDALAVLVQRGGIQGAVRNTPIAPDTLAQLTAALEQNFGSYSDEQGLRFRSSSNIEDAEGFNGAGLYTSNTGYLHAERLADDRRSDSVERAILGTWASYWGSEAFEERRLANVDHLSGAMGVVVHANFPDALEQGNGVFTYTLLPPGHPEGAAVLEVNAQEGALSVTNPPPGDPNLPEVSRMVLDAAGQVSLTRVRSSTLLPPGRTVLSDAQLMRVFDEARRVTERWLEVDGQSLPLTQRRRTLTLDFELREVAQGWPALSGTNVYASRVVIKQARTLEPSIVRVPDEVKNMPIPRDVLARALLVEERVCASDAVAVRLVEVFTDARKPPDLGHTLAPFSAFIVLDFVEDVPELEATAGQRRSAVHLSFTADHPGMLDGGAWSVDLHVDADRAEQLGFSRVEVGAGQMTVTGAGSFSTPASCTATPLFASPEAFLEAILRAR